MRLVRTLLVLLGAFAFASVTTAAAPRVFLAGDSTMANKPLDLPERGWGMAFGAHFKAGVEIRNHAQNGRSTKSFLDECLWEEIRVQLQPGDFVIIQFSHNDEKIEDPLRGTDPATTFRDNLRRFIRETRARTATPILATPVVRRKFDRSDKLEPTHGAYPAAIRAVAREEKVDLLELEHATSAWLQASGNEASKKFFMWIEPGKSAKLPEGVRDDTHFVEAGAVHVAALAAAQIRESGTPLSEWLSSR